ncbi:MAG TPA: AMP-binding protein, partial [Candidatus Kryptonia bacterium]|nr:AMP-binding protein [Candidatus Kryptonia bacterium]
MPLAPTHPSPMLAEYRRARQWCDEPLHRRFDRIVAAQTMRLALVDSDRRLSFLELDRAVRRATLGLRQIGVRAGDVIAYQLPNWWEAVVIFLAGARLGATLNPLLPMFRERELRLALTQTGARVAVIPGVYRGVDYPEMWRALPRVEHIFVARAEAAPGRRSLTEFLATPWEQALRPEAEAAATIDADAILMVMYTSGTTAEPKGVLHTHNTLIAEVDSLARVHQLTPADRTLMPSPLTH